MKHIVLILVLFTLLFILPRDVHADKSYGLPALSSMPRNPHIIKDQGGTFDEHSWKLTVAPGTFAYDTYFQNGCWKRTFPLHIGRYWQLSDICEFWPKPHFKPNSAPAVSEKAWLISYAYSESDLQVIGDISFPENSLKIVFSDDHGKSWTMLKSSVVDTENNTVAAITEGQGGYMVMAGFVTPSTYYNYQDVKGVSTVRGQEKSGFWQTVFEYIGVFIGRAL